MGLFTEFFHMFKPSKNDPAAIAKINEDLDTIDAEMHKPPLTVNGLTPGQDRNISLTEVPLAGNLSSDIAQIVSGTFIQRVSGGGASIEDGSAFLSAIKGNSVHTGQIDESIEMTVNAVSRDDPITATINRDTFVAYVNSSQTITLTYTTSWSANPALYGITITGTPVSGDEIVVVYVKENRGLISSCAPTSFNATGWNLFNRSAGYARVCKYSDVYGFKIGGTYSLVEFSTTVSGSRSPLTLEDGYFNVPSDGFVFVTGSDATTYIYATFTDWTEGYQGDFQSYSVDTIDLTEAMLVFPYGLCAVGNVRDEINLNTQMAIKRIERFGYSAENLAAVIASGVDYDADESYIYAVMTSPLSSSVSVEGNYAVSDHGIEYFAGSSIGIYSEVLYGENLKDKLRTDVLTISEQALSTEQQRRVANNLDIDYEAVSDLDNVVPSAAHLRRNFFYGNTSLHKPTGTTAGGQGYVIGSYFGYYLQVAIPNSTAETGIYVRMHTQNGFDDWTRLDNLPIATEVATGVEIDAQYVNQNSLSVIKYGKMVFINGYVSFKSNTQIPIDTVFLTIPAGFRPKRDWTIIAQRPTESDSGQARVIIVRTGGGMHYHNGSTITGGYFRIDGCYPII